MFLTVNIGSSSLRLGWHDGEAGSVTTAPFDGKGSATVLSRHIGQFIEARGNATPKAVCHRIVHAGAAYGESCFIDDKVIAAIKAKSPQAPLHNPLALEMIEACRALFGAAVPQVAVFDSAFFHNMPDYAALYAIPARLGIRRLGFHGIAHQLMWQAAVKRNPQARRVISLQLGSGASACAVRDGRAVDTSMGFTPLEGLMMNSRCGDIDPGVLLYLQQQKGLSVGDIEHLLNRRSGLRGVSGSDASLKDLLLLDDDQSKLAVDMFCYRIRKYVGTYAAALGGLDAIVVGGGIGEHVPEIRRRSFEGLAFLGVEIDDCRNASRDGSEGVISAPHSNVPVEVVALDENRFMADEAARLFAQPAR